MSIDTLLSTEPPATLLEQRHPGRVDQTGLQLHDLVTVRKIKGRARLDSAQQVAMWAASGIDAHFSFMTLDLRAENGQFILMQDGRTFRIKGIPIRQAKGSIPSYALYPCEQVFMRGSTS